MKEYANIVQAKLDVLVLEDQPTNEQNDGVVQEMNDMRLEFYLPVPLDAGCRITVKLPS